MGNELVKIDSIHYSFNAIDGLDKPFNLIISPREPGKTTVFHISKVYNAWLKGYASILLFRNDVDIQNEVIRAIIDTTYVPFRGKSKFSWQSIPKNGAKFVKVDLEGRPILYFVSLNQPKGRLKKLRIPRIRYFGFDEFIIDTRNGEKYLSDEFARVQELYSTITRDQDKPPKMYFLGNPYSLYNPYFVNWGIDPFRLKKGNIAYGDKWAVERYKMTPELLEIVKKKNPFYTEDKDDAFTKYALEGDAVNDSSIILMPTRPEGFRLMYSVIVGGHYFGLWRKFDWTKRVEVDWWVSRIERPKRTSFAFDFKDLLDNTCLYTKEDRIYLERFKSAVSRRRVGFDSLESDYMVEEAFAIL